MAIHSRRRRCKTQKSTVSSQKTMTEESEIPQEFGYYFFLKSPFSPRIKEDHRRSCEGTSQKTNLHPLWNLPSPLESPVPSGISRPLWNKNRRVHGPCNEWVNQKPVNNGGRRRSFPHTQRPSRWLIRPQGLIPCPTVVWRMNGAGMKMVEKRARFLQVLFRPSFFPISSFSLSATGEFPRDSWPTGPCDATVLYRQEWDSVREEKKQREENTFETDPSPFNSKPPPLLIVLQAINFDRHGGRGFYGSMIDSEGFRRDLNRPGWVDKCWKTQRLLSVLSPVLPWGHFWAALNSIRGLRLSPCAHPFFTLFRGFHAGSVASSVAGGKIPFRSGVAWVWPANVRCGTSTAAVEPFLDSFDFLRIPHAFVPRFSLMPPKVNTFSLHNQNLDRNGKFINKTNDETSFYEQHCLPQYSLNRFFWKKILENQKTTKNQEKNNQKIKRFF